MNRQDIISLALNSGAHEKYQVVYMDFDDLERFFQAAYKAGVEAERDKWMERTAILIRGEREACAKVCEETPWSNWFTADCAAAIRARSNT